MYLYLSTYAFYDFTQVKAHKAVSKLTHATGNRFMEQSFNDCLYNLGSIVTLASNTALSNVFSFSSRASLCAGLPVPTGRAAQLGSHQDPPPLLLLTGSLSVPKSRDGSTHHSSHLPTTHDTSPSCAAISRTSLPCPQNSGVSSLPLKRPAVSRRQLKAKPLPTVILPAPGRREGR